MDRITILKTATAESGTQVGVHAGFPNPAAERSRQQLMLDALLVQSPTSTYYFTVRGHSWNRLGVFDGDIAIVDRSKKPRVGKPVIFWDDTGELRIETWEPGLQESVWGVITAIIHRY